MFRFNSVRAVHSGVVFHLLSPGLVAAVLACLAVAPLLKAQTPSPSPAAKVAEAQNVVVSGAPVNKQDDTRPKLEHIMREVSGTQITVTKKATVIKLDKQPPVENNNLQELFSKAPGLLVSEQQNPGQFNFTYRGLGNAQESEYTTFLQDGLPLASDWIGFPTLYYLPLPQSISEVQLIRGGSSLLYGPEPAPAVNFVTKHPAPGTPWNAYMEEVGGAYGYFSSYAAVQEASGPIEVRLDGGYQHSDGQRDNGEYNLWQANGYIGYRPDNKQLIALDFHASRFEGGDPGRLTLAQFNSNQNFSTTPYNENWVDRYTGVLRYELELGDGWLVQAKGWFTHQEIDSRAGPNLLANGSIPPNATTTLGYEEFNNGGVDLRFRKKWGDDTMFHGSVLTFGGVAYHGDAPFTRYLSSDLYAPRGTTTSMIPLDQSRTSDYQALFIEDLIRIGSFHIVPSFRLDHEKVEVDSTYAPWLPNSTLVPPTTATRGPASISADHLVPLWGIGVGNDFGNQNESYFSATTGWRPTRYFDIAGTSRTVNPGAAISDPFESLDLELGVHGTPIKGFWYDVGLFWMEFSNRTEQQPVPGSNVDFVLTNTGNTRHRGFEGEISYDLLSPFQTELAPEPEAKDGKTVVDGKQTPIPGGLREHVHPFQLIVFSNVQFLDAEFTESSLLLPLPNNTTQTYLGKTPAYAPDILWKGGLTFQKEKCFRLTLSAVYSSEQFWQDSNLPLPATGVVTVPAIIPSYKVLNFSGEWYLTKNVRLIAGVSNLSDEKYYSRTFLTGLIEPAPRLTGYAGLSVEF
jgi:Fe(3+) dicitrate transport protein